MYTWVFSYPKYHHWKTEFYLISIGKKQSITTKLRRECILEGDDWETHIVLKTAWNAEIENSAYSPIIRIEVAVDRRTKSKRAGFPIWRS